MTEYAIHGLKFVLTCGACPEQYDVINGRGQRVGYVRLRWGRFTVDYPDCGGELCYQFVFDDRWKGCFDSDEQRMDYLTKAALALKTKDKEARHPK